LSLVAERLPVQGAQSRLGRHEAAQVLHPAAFIRALRKFRQATEAAGFVSSSLFGDRWVQVNDLY